MRRATLALMAACALAACALASALQFSVSASEQSYLNALHHPSTRPHADALLEAFAQLDANEDGHIDAYEMQALEHEGRISAAEHILLRAFDTDADGRVSQSELTLAPHTLNMLETAVDLAPLPQTDELASAEAAFEGLDSPVSHRRLKSRAASGAQAAEEDTVLAEVAAGAAIPPLGTPRVKAAPGSRRGSAPLPVSQFGVPSVADEECVMCQYFVQRIQNGVADRLENGPKTQTSSPPTAGAEGLPGAAAAAQQALKVRNTNSQLSKKPGGRGIVRVIAEDVIQALCAVDKMPLLFNPYCSGFTEANAINAIRKGIFFNIPTVEVCAQAALCRDDSYLNTNAAVHATKTSLFLNGQRGICGMLGGARDRPNSREGQLLNAICAAHGAVFGQQ